MTNTALATAFFFQMFVILAACRVVGWLARKLGQPQVVGEMIAGVLIGPSLLGLLFPEVQHFIFPEAARGLLYAGAQLGVGIYMFLVGVEFKTSLFRSKLRGAAAVSISGMLVPFVLGALLALWFVRSPGLFSERATPIEAALFLGASMCITAFPMLARIIHERGLTGTALGTLALAAGAIDDAAAWCILAVVLASFGGDTAVAAKAIGGGILYVILVLTLGRMLLAKLGKVAERENGLSPTLLALALMCFCLGAWFTDLIGIHAVFGGFLMGIAMPRGVFARELRKQIEPFAVVFLLPMFFTFSGLNTRLDVIFKPHLIPVVLAVLAVAILGKGVACWAAARLQGEDNRTALAVGTLMNARGLMELIILNIGLQQGIIGRELFSVMVLMAIVTTLMTSPVFEFVYGRHVRNKEISSDTPDPLPNTG